MSKQHCISIEIPCEIFTFINIYAVFFYSIQFEMSVFYFVFFCRDPAILDCLDLTEEEKNVLIDNINRRLTPQAVKIRAGTSNEHAASPTASFG